MGLENATLGDVHEHVHMADLGSDAGNRADSEQKSARTGATHVRVIPAPADLRQEDPKKDRKNHLRVLGNPFAGELAAGIEAARVAAEASDFAKVAMTPVEAAKQIAPAKGEAGGKALWLAMTAAGLARLVWVSIGYLFIQGAETRLRAGIVTLVFALALAGGYLAGLA